ncbi:MAG: 2-oxo acid dehydrogenase subunit E2 [Planctomycetota bacterium]|jgi:pyruvate dehydrogenase E2 component (dihydrolipoamide acetyltransferase)
MATEVKLPQLGQTMEEGTIVSCLVNIGDEVKKGEVIFEVETDKATLEMESPANGFVKHILASDGQTFAVGDVLMVLGEKDEDVPAPTGAVSPSKQESKPSAQTTQPTTSPSQVETPDSANIIRLPQLGQTMEEGTIVTCLTKVGDQVKKGDIIFEIETDKATLEMESPAAGFVKHVLVTQGQTIPVGDPVVVLANKDEEISQAFIDSLTGGAKPAVETKPEVPTAKPETTAAPADEPAIVPSGKVFASPRAKKLARELGLSLSAITSTGSRGNIVEKDVKEAAKTETAKSAPAAPVSDVKLGDVIPLNMLQSKREIPCFYLTVKADVTELVDFRTRLNKTSDVKVAYNDFIIKAVAIGLEHFPIMTGQLDGNTIKLADSIGIGLAIAVPDGLVAPIVKEVEKKTAADIARYSKALVEKARTNKLAPTDLEGGCITVSNLGAFGIESFIPIVVPGQCSILGIGRIAENCVPNNGGIAIRKLVSMTLSVDHKVANGAYAAQFLDFVRKVLEDPSNF